MPIYRSPNGFRDDQPDVRVQTLGSAVRVHDEIGLRCPHPVFDGVSEFRRPSHPVPRRKH